MSNRSKKCIAPSVFRYTADIDLLSLSLDQSIILCHILLHKHIFILRIDVSIYLLHTFVFMEISYDMHING